MYTFYIFGVKGNVLTAGTTDIYEHADAITDLFYNASIIETKTGEVLKIRKNNTTTFEDI